MKQAFDKFDLTGKAAFITGGGTGLGFAMARGLARSGAQVMIAARREDVLRESVAKLQQESGNDAVSYCCMDLSDTESVNAAAQHAIKELGGVDIFIGNAAVDTQMFMGQMTNEYINTMFQINVTSNMLLTQAFTPHMCEQKWGRVIFSSSAMAKLVSGRDAFSTYSASKAALDAFARGAATDVGHAGNITVNSMNLGVYMTDMAQEAFEFHPDARVMFDELTAMTALGRLGDPNEIEGVAQWLASDAASYVTGANLAIDGGLANTLRPNPPKPG